MKYLFIVTSYWAFGELQIAVDFALKLRTLGHKALFLIPPSHENKVKEKNMPYRILIPNARALNKLLFCDIEESFKPDFIVLSDFLNYAFCETHYGLLEEDLLIFSGRIGAFDLYNFALAGKKIDTYGFRAKEISKLSVDNYDFLLQPCPVNQLFQDKGPNCFRYRIFDGIPARTEDEYQKARTSLHIDASEKIIVMTGAVWQSSFKPYKQVKEMVAAVDDRIIEVIRSLPKNYKVYWVGPRFQEFPKELTQVRHVKGLPPAQFEMLVDSGDVFVSANYISTSMVRAALRGVPVVLLGNSYLKRQGEFRSLAHGREIEELKQMDTLYPFRMFPVGWYSFLEPAVRKNPFYELAKCVEVFDVPKVLETVKSVASQSFEQSNSNLCKYRDEWMELPSVEETVSAMATTKRTFERRDTK